MPMCLLAVVAFLFLKNKNRWRGRVVVERFMATRERRERKADAAKRRKSATVEGEKKKKEEEEDEKMLCCGLLCKNISQSQLNLKMMWYSYLSWTIG